MRSLFWFVFAGVGSVTIFFFSNFPAPPFILLSLIMFSPYTYFFFHIVLFLKTLFIHVFFYLYVLSALNI